MIALPQKRRSLLLGAANAGVALAPLEDKTWAQADAPRGYVLGPAEG